MEFHLKTFYFLIQYIEDDNLNNSLCSFPGCLSICTSSKEIPVIQETPPEVGTLSIHVEGSCRSQNWSHRNTHMMYQVKAGNWTSTSQAQNFSYWESTFTPHLIFPSVASLHLPCRASKNITVNDHIALFNQPEGWLCRQAATALLGFSAFQAGRVQRGR